MQTLQIPYVPDVFSYRRRHTRVVYVGNVGVGGDNPIRVQSMTTSLTKDIDATVEQTIRLVEAGCEIVRITTPTPADARCLGPIRERLTARGITVPLVADIHFNPLAALAAADFADKVRINPGNFVDSRKFAVREYTDQQYADELHRIEERFTPLVLKCKERGVAMRIGTNHGSLSDRIMNRFGDTPEGMVQSALEFVSICEQNDYYDIILSMKASNPKVMIAAYRLLAARMARLGMDYPFHLGVTEAGNADDGRIKSAIGIGSLLEDGIGDTIRVSLTEEPEAEVPVAFALSGRYTDRPRSNPVSREVEVPWDFYSYERRRAAQVHMGDVLLGGDSAPAVIAAVDGPLSQQPTAMARLLRWASPAGRRQPKPDAALVNVETQADLEALQRMATRLTKWPQAKLRLLARSRHGELLIASAPYVDGIVVDVAQGMNKELSSAARQSNIALLLEARVPTSSDVAPAVDALVGAARAESGANVVLMLHAPDSEAIYAYRRLVTSSVAAGLSAPIVLSTNALADPLLGASITIGSVLCDGIGDAVLIEGIEDSTSLSFNILQAAGARLSKTDYVACPSCGRTLFDLEETTDRIKARTSHLVGVKLAIMGCIVNGPGEMADADFGYVGGAPGQVNLYVGKTCVERGVPAEVADDRLIELMKAHGKWAEEDDEA